MLYHEWAVPPNTCKYDNYYKNPVIEETFIYQFGSQGFCSSSPGIVTGTAGRPQTGFSITNPEGVTV